ncbi:MAG: pYEATS domain-containing protein [Pseudomonadota bacterium]
MRNLVYILLCWMASCFFAAQAQAIQGDNIATYLGEKRWSWTVFIIAPQKTLNDIKCVQYTLHSTFANPMQKICEVGEPSQAFAYTGQGWGAFEIPIEITYKDGRVEKFEHQLRFGEAAEPKAPQMMSTSPVPGLVVDNVAVEKRRGWWEWTIFLKGDMEALEEVKCVEYTLHETFPNPVREVCGPNDGEHPYSLTTNGWGAFEVKVKIYLKNGRIRNIKHQLKL